MVRDALSTSSPYKVAFVDMRMPPGIDGLDTIEQIWDIDPRLQIVICTAYSDHSWPEICERVGQRDNLLVLKKPFDTIEVQQMASSLLRKWDQQCESTSLLERMAQRNQEHCSRDHRISQIVGRLRIAAQGIRSRLAAVDEARESSSPMNLRFELTAQLEDLHDYMCIVTGASLLAEEVFSLVDLGDDLQRILGEEAIDLCLRFNLELPAHFVGDAPRIHRVLAAMIRDVCLRSGESGVSLAILDAGSFGNVQNVEFRVSAPSQSLPRSAARDLASPNFSRSFLEVRWIRMPMERGWSSP